MCSRRRLIWRQEGGCVIGGTAAALLETFDPQYWFKSFYTHERDPIPAAAGHDDVAKAPMLSSGPLRTGRQGFEPR